jgi:hypothetical protein
VNWNLEARETDACAGRQQNNGISIRARDMTLWTFGPQRCGSICVPRGRQLPISPSRPKSSIAAASRAKHLPGAVSAVVHRNIDLARKRPERGSRTNFHPRNPSGVGKYVLASGRMSERGTTGIQKSSAAYLLRRPAGAGKGSRAACHNADLADRSRMRLAAGNHARSAGQLSSD